MERDDLILRRVAAAYFAGDEVIPCGEARAAIEMVSGGRTSARLAQQGSRPVGRKRSLYWLYGFDRLCAKGLPSPVGCCTVSSARQPKVWLLDTPGCVGRGPLGVQRMRQFRSGLWIPFLPKLWVSDEIGKEGG